MGLEFCIDSCFTNAPWWLLSPKIALVSLWWGRRRYAIMQLYLLECTPESVNVTARVSLYWEYEGKNWLYSGYRAQWSSVCVFFAALVVVRKHWQYPPPNRFTSSCHMTAYDGSLLSKCGNEPWNQISRATKGAKACATKLLLIVSALFLKGWEVA